MQVKVAFNAVSKVNLAIHHLFASARFSRHVGEIEKARHGEQFGEFWEEILHYSSACVIVGASSLEAYANELFHDRKTFFPDYPNALLDKLWETFEQKPILEKFEFALLLRDKPAIDRGAKAYQHAATLIKLRNALTHFKPEWSNEAAEHKKLSSQLNGLFELSPFFPKGSPAFPSAWATHACTKWAVETVKDFATHFETAGTLPAKFGEPVWKARLSP